MIEINGDRLDDTLEHISDNGINPDMPENPNWTYDELTNSATVNFNLADKTMFRFSLPEMGWSSVGPIIYDNHGANDIKVEILNPLTPGDIAPNLDIYLNNYVWFLLEESGENPNYLLKQTVYFNDNSTEPETIEISSNDILFYDYVDITNNETGKKTSYKWLLIPAYIFGLSLDPYGLEIDNTGLIPSRFYTLSIFSQ